MCQAELVHETIAALSLLPLAASMALGDGESVPVFAVTSVISACVDLAFAVMQRYNRPRVLRMARRQRRR